MKLFKKLSLLLLAVFTLQSNKTQGFDLASKLPSTKKVMLAATAVGAFVAGVKIYRAMKNKRIAKNIERQSLEKFNNELFNSGFKITKDTVFAFDLHDVVAKYNILKMIQVSLLSLPKGLTALAYPKIFPVIMREIKKKGSAQQILDAAAQEYPESTRLKNICEIGINISAQLKGIEDTITIMQELMAKGYTVMFASNIEPKLWARFIIDFPMFAKCDKFIVSPDNGWIKKPSPEYFEGLKDHLSEEYFEDNQEINVLFVDDRLKNDEAALAQGIRSYGFINPKILRDDLMYMGVN